MDKNQILKLAPSPSNKQTEIKKELIQRCRDIIRFKQENDPNKAFNREWFYGGTVTELDIENDGVFITIYETWKYGGQEDHNYHFTWEELKSDEWQQSFIDEVRDIETKRHKINMDKKMNQYLKLKEELGL